MKIYISQIYAEASVSYPFTHHFQRFVSEKLSTIVSPSTEFIDTYGEDWDVIFRMSAKSENRTPEIKGPTVFRRDKDVEYTVFLPFDKSQSVTEPLLRDVLRQLIETIAAILADLSMDTTALQNATDEMITMVLENPVWWTKKQETPSKPQIVH